MVTTFKLAAELRAIEAALAPTGITVIRTVIDMNRNVIATYRRTVRLPRDSHPEPHPLGGQK